MLQLKQDALSKRWIVSAGNPTHVAGIMTVSLKAKNKEAAKLSFNFPEGLYVGQPQTKNITY